MIAAALKTDASIAFDFSILAGDLVLAAPDLATGDELFTAVVMSLFTWRRARADDRLPDFTTDRKGWWGDSYPPAEGDRIGSRLWLLVREKVTQETVNRARDYAVEALAWMVEDRVASSVDVTAERSGIYGVDLAIVIERNDGRRIDLRFDGLWRALNG